MCWTPLLSNLSSNGFVIMKIPSGTFPAISPNSLEAIKCITELLMKRLIPYSHRDLYSLLISSIASLLTVRFS